MGRYDGVKDILRLALEMQNSYQGFSIQDIQDDINTITSIIILILYMI